MSERELSGFYRNLGVAFQGGALFSSMTVGENIMLPLREHTDLDQKTMEIMVRFKLDIVSLGGFENLMPSQLSGGMLKRAALARAIALDPEILFFDEPSAGLEDTDHAAAIRSAVEQLPDRQRVAVVLHRFSGLSIRETSEATGWSESAVESMLVRAYASLRQALRNVSAR